MPTTLQGYNIKAKIILSSGYVLEIYGQTSGRGGHRGLEGVISEGRVQKLKTQILDKQKGGERDQK